MTHPTRDRIYAAIIAHKRAHDGNSPTVRELATATGISSTAHVNYHLRQLVRDGRIERDGHGIVVVGGEWRMQ